MSNQYYGLVSGLQQLVASKSGEINLSEFKATIAAQLEPKDYFQFLLLFYPYDNSNFIAALQENEEKPTLYAEANLKSKELDGIIKNNVAEDVYFQTFIDRYQFDFSELDLLKVEKSISQHYYDFVQQEGIPFLAEWMSFELTLKNLTAIHTQRRLEIEEIDLIKGGLFSPVQLKRINLSDLDKEFPYLKRLFETLEITDPIQRKRTTDEIKWEYLDHLTFFNFFSIEKILAHTIKMKDLLDWQQLDAEIGKTLLNQYLEQIDKELESKLT